MDLPKPPEDHELRTIIDKLAQFVARNGPEFEQMTKDKQRDNPRFYFLFGGEYFNYYQYRVSSEHAMMRKQQEQQPQHMIGPPMMASGVPSGPPPHQTNIWQNNGINNMNNNLDPNVISQQINELQEQIRQSEANLAAQHQVLLREKQILTDDLIRQLQDEHLKRMAEDFNINLNDFENVLVPIIDNCTKESIANGKMWIFNNCNAPIHYDVISKYLLKRVSSPTSPFECRLHVLYLINDLFNHCMRKGDDSLKRSLEKVIVPIFGHTFADIDDEKQQKLTKLLKLWEMNQYFDRSALDQLQNPALALANYKTALLNEFSGQISSVANGQLAKYNQLQKQHSDFVAHIQTKIQNLQQQKQQIVQNVQQMPPNVAALPMPVNSPLAGHPSVPRLLIPPNQLNQPPPLGPTRPPMAVQFDQPPPTQPPTSVAMFLPMVHQTPPPGPPPISNANQSQPLLIPHLHQTSQMGVRLGPVPQMPQQMVAANQPFPNSMPGPPFPPSHIPNNQFFNAVPNPTPMPPKEVIPDVPYFELPAGLMAPLVKLEDFEYIPIVPTDIRLPPPAPPNDRLLQAVDAFYAPPTHERPRNSDGWEQLGLYEFFKAKSHAKRVREESRDGSHLSDSHRNSSKNTSNNQNDSKNHYNSESQSQSSSHSKRSPSPKRKYREYREDKSPRKNKSSRRSRSRSRSPSSTRRRHSRSRSRSRSPIRSYRSRSRSRSPSPPHFGSYHKPETRIDESNKGHQMLKKMGWTGNSGLGASEQGIQDPIKGGEVREANELYRGVGVKSADSDPFEKFRKNKGQAFLQRITQGRTEK